MMVVDRPSGSGKNSFQRGVYFGGREVESCGIGARFTEMGTRHVFALDAPTAKELRRTGLGVEEDLQRIRRE